MGKFWGLIVERETILNLKAAVLRWKCRTYSFAAIPFILLIAFDVISHGTLMPLWAMALSTVIAGVLGAFSTMASFDHRDLTGRLVWF